MEEVKCVRCETQGRKKQKDKNIYFVNVLGDSVPLCGACLLEMQDEELFDLQESDESRSEEFDW